MKSTTAGIPYDLRDTCALKTIGILAIVLHNFYHSIPGATLENEFFFEPGRFETFLASVVDFRETFQSTLSYFGHYGVELFIFVSAYGLALKYWTTPSWGSFVWGRIRKIYPMFFLAVGLWLLLRLIEHRSEFPEFVLGWSDELVLTTLGIINLVPGYGLPPVGPWWFLPFIVQFYCLWPALAAFSRRAGVPGLLALAVVSLGVTIVAGPFLVHKWSFNLTENPLGHMPEICLGIACARYGARVGPVSALLATVLFVLGNLRSAFWPLTFICALIVILYLYRLVAGVLRKTRFIDKIAEISMPLFFVNGFLRSPFRHITIYLDRWYVELVAGWAFALFSVGVAYGLLRIEQRIFSRRPKPKQAEAAAG
jgi:peptidoglycan/LPS O-acetylase OafA/YrhL